MADEFPGWNELWKRIGASGSPRPVMQQLVAAYAEPHRAYHTLAHIFACLAEFEPARHLARYPDEVELALWFHDVVYDPHAADNEARSADRAVNTLGEAGVAAAPLAHVHDLILATRHDGQPVDPDAWLAIDVDLAIFGRPEPEFDRYETQIRQEYHWVPQDDYRRLRAQLLESFLDRRAIYRTAFFHERYDWQARANLARSIRRLRG
jgi:predicted metal-dependent HD superfamily phosphohydrolase